MKKTIRRVWSVILAAFMLFGMAPLFVAQAADVIAWGATPVNAVPALPALAESKAAQYIENQLAKFDHRKYVYSDFCAGENTYTQKAWIGSNDSNIPEMEEYAEGYEGISGIKATLNLRTHTWGGYMFTNGVLSAGSSSPGADLGRVDGGVDLTGSDKLVFMARGETGKEAVEFYVGGLGWNFTTKVEPFADSTTKISLGTVNLSKEWKRYEIPLGNADLSRINCGFAWVTNDISNPGLANVTFYIDDIYYSFPEKQSPPVFLQSFASAPVGTDASTINNFAYTYDNAMAIMALCYAGKTDRAKQIADALVYAVNYDRDYSDGRIRNAYSSGDVRSFPNWYSVKGTEFARMPGFYDIKDKTWYEDKGTLSTSAGNAAWAVLGLMEAYRTVGDAKYLRAAQKIGDFLLTLKSEKGGFTGGYEGWDNAKITYKSTEHNIDLISAFAILANHSDGTKKQEYASASEHAKEFVLSMYDGGKGCFYTGTDPDGVTINKTVLPLDVNTWSILAMPDFENKDKVMRFVEENMRVGEGYDFNDDRDGVWFEGTAQVAVVYNMIGDTDKYGEILVFMNKNTASDGSITAADRDNVTTGFDWEYGKRTHLGATAWLAFAEMRRNPFATLATYTVEVTGKVTSATGDKRPATVTLKQNGNNVYTTQTNQNGEYVFNNVTPGNYSLVITKASYLSYTKTSLTVNPNNPPYKNVTLIPGDINGDDYINYNDFLIFLANYNKQGAGIGNPAADINGDGYVDYNDFITFLSGYGKSAVVE